MASLSSKGQVIKEIGGEKMILLTIKQGEKVNSLIDSLEYKSIGHIKSIKLLRDSLVQSSIIYTKKEIELSTRIDELNARVRINRIDTRADRLTICVTTGLIILISLFKY